jgi:hypothetical protein
LASLRDTGPRLRGAVPAVAFVLLVVAVFANPLFIRRNFGGRDLVVYNLPTEKVVHDAWSRGRLPVWNPWISGGRPLAANPNAGALYPVRAGFGLLPFPAAMRVFPVLHWIAAGIGMILLLGALGVSPAGSWIGAVTYTLSGVGISEVFFPHIHPGMALLPWLVWALARRTRRSGIELLVLSLLFGAIFLAGDVFTSGMAILCCGLWIVVEVSRAERTTRFVLLGLAVLLGMLFALPQILATALWIPETNRAVVGMRLGESVFFSIHPLRLFELVVPYLFGWTWTLDNSDVWAWPIFRGKAMGLFSTLYAGAFAAVAVVSSWRSGRPGTRFARAIIVFAGVVAIVPSLIPAAWEGLESPLPLRNPEKFAAALTFGIAILAGVELDRIRAAGRRPRWILGAAVGLSAAAAVAALFPEAIGRAAVGAVGGTPRMVEAAALRIPGALAEGGLFWIATVVALDLLARGRNLHVAASLALLTLVPIAANRKIARTLPEQEMFAPTQFVRYLRRADPDNSYRVVGEGFYPTRTAGLQLAGWSDEYMDAGRRLWFHHTPALWNRGVVFNFDFDAGDFSRMEALRKMASFAAGYEDTRLFQSLSLRWGIRFRNQPPLPGYVPFAGDALQLWDRLPGALPSVRLVERWTEETSSLPALKSIPKLGPGEVVLETGVRSRATARRGALRIRKDLPELLEVDVEAPDPTWLFVLRGYWIHRTVLVDGKAVADVPAQVAFSAAPIPAGRHHVEWRERVPGLEVSRWGPILSALLLTVLIVRDRRNVRS